MLVATLWCDLARGCCSRTVMVNKAVANPRPLDRTDTVLPPVLDLNFRSYDSSPVQSHPSVLPTVQSR